MITWLLPLCIKYIQYDFLFIALIFRTTVTFWIFKEFDKFGIFGKPELKRRKKKSQNWKKKQTKNENFKIFIHISCSMKNLFKNISVISDCENKCIGNFILKNWITRYDHPPSNFVFMNSRKISGRFDDMIIIRFFFNFHCSFKW